MTSGRALLVALLLAVPPGTVVTAQARPAEQSPAETPDEAAEKARPRRVLALYSEASDHPINVSFIRQFHAVLEQQSGNTVEHYVEYYEAARFPGEEQARLMRDYLRQKYADRKIDVLFPWGPFNLQFVLKYRAELFPDTPIVYYSGTLDEVRGYQLPPMTGVLNPDTYERTVDLMLSLHPGTKEVLVISGTPGRDRSIEHDIAVQLEEFKERVKISYLTDVPLDRLLATIRNLSPGTLLLYSRQQQDEAGRVMQQSDYVDLISRTASVPLYGPWLALIGYGSVGGVVDDREAGARKAAEIVLRVARGARPEDIPPERTPRVATFDAQQLKRWGIREERLPPGSIVLFRDSTIWSRYRYYIVATAVLLGVQTALIAGLLVQGAKRRRVEQALRESERRYTLATAAGSVGVWDWNLETGEVYLDPAMKRVLGFSDDEIENQFESWSQHVHPDDAERLRLEAQTQIENGTPFFEIERRMLHRDGSVRWFLTRGSAVREPGGGVTRVTGTNTDITERRHAEARLEDARLEYTRIARVATLAQFAASIAHEVSQPLSAILMNSRACLRWLDGSDVPIHELRPALQDIVEAADRAKQVVTRDRELFRHRAAVKEAVELKHLVGNVAALARTRLEQSSVRLLVRIDRTVPPVIGDEVQLQQVLLNLFLNGIEAMEAVDTRSRRMTVDARLTEEDFVQVSVHDTGPGLQDVDIDRLFAPFYTTKPAGTGVGLSLSRSIVEAHGGQIWVEPDNRPGATFRFTLPAAVGLASEEAADTPPVEEQIEDEVAQATSPDARRSATD
jgi:PAS domain S-box-containing protein